MAWTIKYGHVTDDVTCPSKVLTEAVRSAILATAWLLVLSWDAHGRHGHPDNLLRGYIRIINYLLNYPSVLSLFSPPY